VFLDDEVGQLARADREAVRSCRSTALDGVSITVLERHEAVIARHVGKVEACYPLHRSERVIASLAERLGESSDRLTVGSAIEATDSDVYGVDRTTTDCLHHQVARALQIETPLHRAAVVLRELNGVAVPEEVRSMQQIYVE
jgi:hypothetical protein